MRFEFQEQKESASVLLICLVSALVIGITLGSCLVMIANEHATVLRDQAWNRSLVVAESGIEDGLALINKSANWSNNATVDHWTQSGNVFHVSRSLGSDYYDTYITNLNNAPALFSVSTAVFKDQWGKSNGIQRAIYITTALTSGYNYAILAQKNISLSGVGVYGFNSADPNLSENGQFATNKFNDGASIATDETNIARAINISGGEVYGHAYTGAGSSVYTTGSASVGSTSYVPTPGIESNWSASTMNTYVPKAPSAPAATYFPLPSAVSNLYTLSGFGSTNCYRVPDGTNLSGGAEILITNGTVVLDCTGSFSISGSLVISPNSALEAFLNGQTTLSGSGVVNETGFATNCAWYGSTNCTRLTISGSSNFIGTIDAPQAHISYSSSATFIGAAIGKSFTDSDGAAIVYDESLASPSTQIYVVQSWAEVPLRP